MKIVVVFLLIFCSLNLAAQLDCEDMNSTSFLNSSVICHHDVNCPIGDDWEHYKNHLKRSVVTITTAKNENPDHRGSGVLINNTSQNRAPYILTALHNLNPELPSTGPAVGMRFDDYKFTFDWISPTSLCGDPGENDAGSVEMVLCGAEILAFSYASDYVLLAADGEVPEEWNRVWAGWDKTDNLPTFEVGIHHPNGDVMKICRDDSGATQYDAGGNFGEQWLIDSDQGGWELGMTDGGSSGSPLFDQNGRVIGQLSGGGANGQCNSDGTTTNTLGSYGRFAINWENGLQNWLDPALLNPDILESLPPLVPPTPTQFWCTSTKNDQQIFWNDIPGAVSYILTIVPNGCCIGIGGNNPPPPISVSVTDNFISISDLNLGFFNCIQWSVRAKYSNDQISPVSAIQCFSSDSDCLGLDFRMNAGKLESKVEIKVFPNPSSGQIYVNIEPRMEDSYHLNVYGIDGTIVKTYKNLSVDQISIEGKGFPIQLDRGIYFFHITYSSTAKVQKVIVE